MIFEPFILRALAAAVALSVVAAPLGCLVLWNRMSYFGEAIAQASLLGIALGLLLQTDLNVSVLLVTIVAALTIVVLSQQRDVPMDSILGLIHHGALALGVIAVAAIQGQSVDLIGYLFGDIFAVSTRDLWWMVGLAAVLAAVMRWGWSGLLRMSVHDDLAQAEGLNTRRLRAVFVIALAAAVAVAIKVVGILLAVAFLIVPAVAARPFSRGPLSMVAASIGIATVASVAGILLSLYVDVPGGPAIVVVMTIVAALSLVFARRHSRG